MRPQPVPRQLLGLVLWLLITFVAAAIGAVASVNAGPFYAALVRPDWAPPGGVFAPVWTTLYILMALAAWLVWRVNGFRTACGALTLFIIQLALNALWSWLFFGWQLGALAFAEVLLLWLCIAATLIGFWRIHALAGVLLLPYFAWVSFAAILNYTVWQLNPAALG